MAHTSNRDTFKPFSCRLNSETLHRVQTAREEARRQGQTLNLSRMIRDAVDRELLRIERDLGIT